MEKILVSVLQGFLNFVQNASQFLSEQTPQYVRELLSYFYFSYMLDFWNQMIWVAILVAIIVAISILWWSWIFSKRFKEKCKKEEEWMFGAVFGSALFIIFVYVILGFAILGTSINKALEYYKSAYKVKNAPRVFIIEYLNDKLKEK
jgi:hypothetical protein